MKNFRIEVKWAIIFTIASLLWMMFEKAMGWHDELIDQHPFYTLLFSLVAVLIYVLALLDKRNNFYNGKMSWKEGFVSGIIMSIVVAILSPLAQLITFRFITPNFLDNAIDQAVETGTMTREAASAYFNLSSYMLQSFFGALVMGIVTAGIVAWFVKRK